MSDNQQPAASNPRRDSVIALRIPTPTRNALKAAATEDCCSASSLALRFIVQGLNRRAAV